MKRVAALPLFAVLGYCCGLVAAHSVAHELISIRNETTANFIFAGLPTPVFVVLMIAARRWRVGPGLASASSLCFYAMYWAVFTGGLVPSLLRVLGFSPYVVVSALAGLALYQLLGLAKGQQMT